MIQGTAVPITHAPDLAWAENPRAYVGLFALAAGVCLLDAAATLGVRAFIPEASELNAFAARVLELGPIAVLAFKMAILAEVAAAGSILQRLGALRAGRLMFGTMAALGAWGVGSAVGVLLDALR